MHSKAAAKVMLDAVHSAEQSRVEKLSRVVEAMMLWAGSHVKDLIPHTSNAS